MTALTGTDNPILWQETTHQRRNAPRFLSRLTLAGPLLIALMIVVVGLTLLMPDYPTRELGIFAIWLVQIVTVVRALVAGANAISREHVGLTWDSLVLTGISTRQILFGKWQAVLRRVAPWMLMLGTIRLAMIPIFEVALVNVYAWYSVRYATYSGYNGQYNYPDYTGDVYWVPWAAILAVVMSVVLTVLEVLACTALGLAASAVTRQGITAMMAALLVRFVPVMVFAAFTRYELGSMSSYSYRVLRFGPFAIADSGTAPLSRLSVPYTRFSITTHVDALYGLSLATLVLIVLLVGSVTAAWIAIRRTGALPHPKPPTI